MWCGDADCWFAKQGCVDEKRNLVTVGPVMINCDPGGSQSQVSRPSEPEWGQSGRLILLSERLQAAGGSWRQWRWHRQYSAHLRLPVSAHDCGAYNNPLIFANVLWLMVLAGGPISILLSFWKNKNIFPNVLLRNSDYDLKAAEGK